MYETSASQKPLRYLDSAVTIATTALATVTRRPYLNLPVLGDQVGNQTYRVNPMCLDLKEAVKMVGPGVDSTAGILEEQ